MAGFKNAWLCFSHYVNVIYLSKLSISSRILSYFREVRNVTFLFLICLLFYRGLRAGNLNCVNVLLHRTTGFTFLLLCPPYGSYPDIPLDAYNILVDSIIRLVLIFVFYVVSFYFVLMFVFSFAYLASLAYNCNHCCILLTSFNQYSSKFIFCGVFFILD